MTDASVRSPARALIILLVLTVVPLVMWHRVLSDELSAFHWSLAYAVTDMAPWLLLLAGIGFLVPVALSAGGNPESRLYPRGRRSYFVWGVVLYLLGVVLAFQVFDVWSYAH